MKSLTMQLIPKVLVKIIAQSALKRIHRLEGCNGWKPSLAIQQQQKSAELHIAPKLVGGLKH
jgi:hypothetical protein